MTLSLLCGGHMARAFAPDVYAPHSVLASGRWVKIRVSSTGLHLITNQQLSAWGFSNPASVRIHGYGARPLADVMLAANYVDDLPLVQSQLTSRGLTFYAVGPVTHSMSLSGTMTHTRHGYATVGYYYLTDAPDVAARAIEPGADAAPASAQLPSTVAQLLVHEQELSSPGGTGQMMVGEDFNYTRSRQFQFTMPDRADGTPVSVTCGFVAKAAASSTIAMAVNGESMPVTTSDRIDPATDIEHFGNRVITTKVASMGSGDNVTVKLTYQSAATVTLANLDYLNVTYQRRAAMPQSGQLDFFLTNGTGALGGASASTTHVWDVTDPLLITAVPADVTGGWRSHYTGVRHYAAWSENAALPAPERVAGDVPCQDLHGMDTPEMVIITHPAFMRASQRLARMHTDDPVNPLKVAVVTTDQVLHEFGSGAFDPRAIRYFLKMLYDRSNASGSDTRLRYALIMGKGTFDNRAVTGVGRSQAYPVPIWVTESSLMESSAYCSDDYLAFLEDGSGQRPGNDRLSIALGRIPCVTPSEADAVAEKICTYAATMPRTDWRNKVLMLADDENKGDHMYQTEDMQQAMLESTGGGKLMFNKVYVDAYPWQNGSYPQARSEFYRHLNSGALLWTYVGHGSPRELCYGNMITYTDINNSFYLRRVPFCYAATCSFLRWDNDVRSAAEILMFNTDGGFIGCISAVRAVFISANGVLTKAFGKEFARLDSRGLYRPMGDVYRDTKNRLTNDENRLRFVFMGDPALRLVLPDRSVVLESVDGEPVAAADAPGSDPTVLKALQRVTLAGSVRNVDGSLMDTFSGNVTLTLYDADISTVSRGRGPDGEQVPFDEHGALLFTTSGRVTSGRFSVVVNMPGEVADNFRPTSLNMYASSADGLTDAMGVCRDLYVFGLDETAEADTEDPVIHSMVVNHPSFTGGDRVNEQPTVIATLSDNVGINLSTAGVGHQMTVTVDGTTTYTDVSGSFTLDPDTERGMSGTVSYRIPDVLSAGRHTLRLRVFDLAGNYAEQQVEVEVVPGLAPKIAEVYTDTNPAVDKANFYVTHNRPDERLTVRVTVYNLLGQPVWSGEATGRSDMFTSVPLTWDLTDSAGRRVGRGVYIYRATIENAAGQFDTASKKIAVASPQ